MADHCQTTVANVANYCMVYPSIVEIQAVISDGPTGWCQYNPHQQSWVGDRKGLDNKRCTRDAQTNSIYTVAKLNILFTYCISQVETKQNQQEYTVELFTPVQLWVQHKYWHTFYCIVLTGLNYFAQKNILNKNNNIIQHTGTLIQRMITFHNCLHHKKYLISTAVFSLFLPHFPMLNYYKF